MNSRLQRKLTYVRDRAVNAYWMVRQGRFRQVYQGLLLELQTRKDQAGSVLATPDTPVQRAGGRNPCKSCPISPRPAITVQAPAPPIPRADLDAVAATLDRLLATGSGGSDDAAGPRR